MATLRVFSYLPNPRLYKATIAARFSGAEIDILGDKPPKLVNWLWDYEARALNDSDKDTLSAFAREGVMGFTGTKLYKTDAFLDAHPFGNVPAGFIEDGKIGVFESNSIMRAAARAGTVPHTLLGTSIAEQSRIDSFLDRSLVFARDLQRYLLAGDDMNAALHKEMASEVLTFASGLDRALQNSAYLVGDAVTLADIGAVCDLCQLTYERGHAERFDRLGLDFLVPMLKPCAHLGAYLNKLADDRRFADDLERYFETLLPIFDPG
ncbi:MAG: glutathione S-transferase [Pseudomonadota bacterium]